MPYFLELTAFFPTFAVPRPLVEAHPFDWFLPGRIVTNGPFELERWRVGDRIRLRRSASYWNRDAIGVESIDALPVENSTTALNLYLTGDVDWLPDYPGDLSDALRQRSDHYSGPAFIVYYYRVNTSRPPLDDARVRQALALAIDRETIVRDVLRLGQIAAHHIVPPGVPGYEPPPSLLGFDPERARALLAEAGFPGGEGFPEIGILYNTLESHKVIAELIADQLRRNLGIRAKPYNQEWQAYLATTLAGEYDLARAGWVGDYLDPNTFLDIWITGGGNNQTGFSDPLYDRLIRAAADVRSLEDDASLLAEVTEPDRVRLRLDAMTNAERPAARTAAAAELRMALLREAEAILVQQEFPVIPIYFYVVKGLVKPHVRGFYSRLVQDDGTTTPNLQDLHPLRGIRLAVQP
jgi:oligopeptide transport system substrate-binding protein